MFNVHISVVLLLNTPQERVSRDDDVAVLYAEIISGPVRVSRDGDFARRSVKLDLKLTPKC